MTNKSHRSVNARTQTFLVGILLLWLTLVVLASGFVAAGGVSLPVTLSAAAICAAPILSTLLALSGGKTWPRGRRALLVCFPWILMSAFFVALSGGLSSPAMVFAAFPTLFALAFGWRRLAVETAVFSLIAATGAILLAGQLAGMPGIGQMVRASEMFAFAGLCVLPFLVAGLVSLHHRAAAPFAEVPVSDGSRDDGPAAASGLEPLDGSEAGAVMIVDVTREGRIRSASGAPPFDLSFRPGRVFLHSFPDAAQPAIAMRFKAGGTFTEAVGDGQRAEFTIDRHDLGTRVFLSETRETGQVSPARQTSDSDERVREAERALKARTTFFAGLGHELKTPLNAILGFSDLMRTELRGPLPGPYKDYAELIHESGQDLLLMVEDILDYAKAEAGHVRVELEPVDLVASGESVVAQLSGQAARAGVTIRMLARGEVWAKADPRAVRQIWQNLLSNAIKYSENGSTVTLDARKGQGAVALSVRDTGAGMDKDDLERVSRPFEQGRNASGKAGTGLGLAVVQAFAKEMRGKVIIDTAPGEGTRVRVILPKAPREDVGSVEDAAE